MLKTIIGEDYPMVSEEIWFSQRERIYSIVKGKIEWTDQKDLELGSLHLYPL